jgi:FkbM family methyltransferase
LAIEPDPKNYKKLVKFSEQVTSPDIKTVNSALWSENTVGSFAVSGNRNSSVSSTSSYQHREELVNLVSLDSVCEIPVDYIKYDVEGAEYEALVGSYKLISEYKPSLLVSLYHRSRDLFVLPIYINENHKGYRFYLKRKLCLPAWELELIALPEERT